MAWGRALKFGDIDPSPPPRVLLWVAALWALFIPLSGLRLAGPGIVADVFLALAAAGLLMDSLVVRRRPAAKNQAVQAGLIAAFALIMIMSSYNAANVDVSVQTVLMAGAGYCAGFFVCSKVVTCWPQGALTLIRSYVLGCVVLSASLWLLPTMLAGRKVGLAGHPVEVGGSVAIAFSVLVFLEVRGWRWKLVKVIALLILSSAFVASESATGVVCVLVALAVTQITLRKVTMRQFVTICIGLSAAFALLVSSQQGSDLLSKVFTSTDNVSLGYSGDISEANTLQSRLVTIELGLEKIRQHPIMGVGFDSGNIVLGQLAPHNLIVSGWLSGGIVALFLLVGLLFLTFLYMWRPVRGVQSGLHPLVAGATAAWAAAMSGPSFYTRTWVISVFLFIALNTSVGPRRKGREVPSSRGLHRGRSALVDMSLESE